MLKNYTFGSTGEKEGEGATDHPDQLSLVDKPMVYANTLWPQANDLWTYHSTHIFIGSDPFHLRVYECQQLEYSGNRFKVLKSDEWSISNFLHSLTRNVISHSMKNLALHSLLRWKMTILQIVNI